LTVYPNNKNNNNKLKSKPLELYELAGKKLENLHSSFTIVILLKIRIFTKTFFKKNLERRISTT
jgi:hypothetical protein